jgi:hypothetical protein
VEQAAYGGAFLALSAFGGGQTGMGYGIWEENGGGRDKAWWA